MQILFVVILVLMKHVFGGFNVIPQIMKIHQEEHIVLVQAVQSLRSLVFAVPPQRIILVVLVLLVATAQILLDAQQTIPGLKVISNVLLPVVARWIVLEIWPARVQM